MVSHCTGSVRHSGPITCRVVAKGYAGCRDNVAATWDIAGIERNTSRQMTTVVRERCNYTPCINDALHRVVVVVIPRRMISGGAIVYIQIGRASCRERV